MMKLILLNNALQKGKESLREAVRMTGEIEADDRYPVEKLPELRRNLEEILALLEGAMPREIGAEVEKETKRLTEPQFGWCSQCGAEWVGRPTAPKEPASRCKLCRAQSEARTMEKPQNPPRDFRQNPLMDFLDVVEKEGTRS